MHVHSTNEFVPANCVGNNTVSVRKSRLISFILLIVVLLCALLCMYCGCSHRFAGNYPYYSYVDLCETDNGFAVYDYKVDTYYNYYDVSNQFTNVNTYLEGGTAPRYLITTPDGFEGVAPHLTDLLIDDSKSVLYVCGYVDSNILYGFVNVYKDTVGYLSGGGNYALEEIAFSVIFQYNPNTDSFVQIKRLDACNAVAYRSNTVLYWKDKAYYSFDISTGLETLLVQDQAHDTGLQHQSYTNIYTNQQYTVLFMTKAHGTNLTEYFYLYCYATNTFTPLQSYAVIACNGQNN